MMNRVYAAVAVFLVAAPLLLPGPLGCRDRQVSIGEDPDHQHAIEKLRKALFFKLGREEYAKAAEILESVAARRPRDASVYCNLGIAYWKMNRREEAYEAFKRAADLNATDPRPLEFLAQAYFQEDDWEKARLILDRAFQRDSESPAILTAMAAVEARLGNPVRAHEILLEALGFEQNYPPALYDLAVIHRDYLNNRAAAITYFEKFLAVLDDPEIKDNLPYNSFPEPEILDRARRYVVAAKTAPGSDAQIPLQPPEPEPGEQTPAEAARRAIESRDFDQALIMLKKAVKEDPDDADALWELARLYERLDDPMRADVVFEAFSQRFPEDARGSQRRREQEHDNAEEPETTEHAAVVTTTGSDEGTGVRMGDALQAWSRGLESQNEGDTDAAMANYKRALELDDTLVSAHYNLALLYKEAGRHEKAKDHFLHAVTLHPEMSQGHYMLGVTYRELGENAKAIEHLGKVLELDPENGMAHFVLALLHRDAGETKLVKLHAKQFLKTAGTGPYADQARRWLNENESP